MATRPSAQPPNRQVGYGGNGSASNSVDVGAVAIARMAREDTHWFVIAVVVLSVVLFLALPLSLLVYADAARLQAEVRYEVRQLKKLKKEVEETKKQPPKEAEE